MPDAPHGPRRGPSSWLAARLDSHLSEQLRANPSVHAHSRVMAAGGSHPESQRLAEAWEALPR